MNVEFGLKRERRVHGSQLLSSLGSLSSDVGPMIQQIYCFSQFLRSRCSPAWNTPKEPQGEIQIPGNSKIQIPSFKSLVNYHLLNEVNSDYSIFLKLHPHSPDSQTSCTLIYSYFHSTHDLLTYYIIHFVMFLVCLTPCKL